MAKLYALSTTSRFKTYAGVSGTTDDTLIENLIDIVTEFIENYVGRRFQQTTYTDEQYDGTGTDKLILKNYPISTFTRLQERQSISNEDTWATIDSEDYFVDTDNGIITAQAFRFIPNTKFYRVTYVAGFDFDNSATFLGDTEGGGIG